MTDTSQKLRPGVVPVSQLPTANPAGMLVGGCEAP